MATKVIEAELWSEVLSILKERQKGSTFLSISTHNIREELKKRNVIFTMTEFCVIINDLIREQ